jgi:hypothetical protein
MRNTTTTIELPSRSIHLEGDEETILQLNRYLTKPGAEAAPIMLNEPLAEEPLVMPEMTWGDPPEKDEEAQPKTEVVANGEGVEVLALPVLNFVQKVKAAARGRARCEEGAEALPLPVW